MNNNLNTSSPNLASPGSSRLRPSGPSSLLGVVEPHQAPIPSLLKVSADSFEQWLKLATDNVSLGALVPRLSRLHMQPP